MRSSRLQIDNVKRSRKDLSVTETEIVSSNLEEALEGHLLTSADEDTLSIAFLYCIRSIQVQNL